MEIIETRTSITIKVDAGEVIDLSKLTPKGMVLESVTPLIHPAGLMFYLNERYLKDKPTKNKVEGFII